MNLSYAPRVWQASTAAKAMNMLSKRKYDLVIVGLRISDMDPLTLGKMIKESDPQKPVVLLVFDESELQQLPQTIPKEIIDDVINQAEEVKEKEDIVRGELSAGKNIRDLFEKYKVF